MVWYYICPDGNVANVWDNHGGTGSLGGLTGYEMLKANYCLPPLDLAYTALLEDLTQRGLLDDTLVVMVGEFGRTPKINPQQGRDHWGACQSIVLAGGGIRGGQVYGASDAIAAYPTQNPMTPEDLTATVYHAMGLEPETLIRDSLDRPHRLSEGRVVHELFA
jgi:arylsulfatase A-like enzyme